MWLKEGSGVSRCLIEKVIVKGTEKVWTELLWLCMKATALAFEALQQCLRWQEQRKKGKKEKVRWKFFFLFLIFLSILLQHIELWRTCGACSTYYVGFPRYYHPVSHGSDMTALFVPSIVLLSTGWYVVYCKARGVMCLVGIYEIQVFRPSPRFGSSGSITGAPSWFILSCGISGTRILGKNSMEMGELSDEYSCGLLPCFGLFFVPQDSLLFFSRGRIEWNKW